MLQKLKIPIIIIVTAVLTQLAGYAVHASMPDALLAAGTTRYATASASSAEAYPPFSGWVDLPGMTKYITIPSGKTADVMVVFCGAATVGALDIVFVRALIRDVNASPILTRLVSDDDSETSRCAIFHKTNVAAGSPAVKIQWQVSGSLAPVGTMNARDMFVIVNIH